MQEEMTYYFGWCTWMNSDELHRYWPEAKIIGKGYADNYRVLWMDASGRGDRGWCHLDNDTKSWGHVCEGIIAEVPKRYYGEQFDDFCCPALTVRGEDGKYYNCWTYTLGDPGQPMKAPYFYWDNCVAGLNEQGFGYEYIKEYLEEYTNAPDGPRMDRPNPNPGRPGRSAAER